MLSLLNKGIEPSTPIADAITYLTAVKHLQSVSGDCGPVVEKIKDLLSSSKTRLYGLVLLKIALEQNLEIYVKANWNAALFDILNDTTSGNLKQHACEVLCLLLPYMAKESQSHTAHANDLKKFYKDLFPLLLSEIDENVEWSKAALKCVYVCLKTFPHLLIIHKQYLTNVILKKISYSVSSSIFEIVAECFAELPNVVRNPASYMDEWKTQYLTVLNSLQRLLNVFHTGEPFASTRKGDSETETYYIFPDDGTKEDMHQAFMKGARQYINLCKCLAKMLSTQSRFAVEIPIKRTLVFTTYLFQVQDIKNVRPTEVEQQIFHSVLSQMQLATLAILESLLLNFNVLPYSSTIAEVMESALIVSTIHNSVEPVSQIRLAVWKFLKTFIKKHGSSVSGDVIKLHDSIIREILADISIEEKKLSQSANQASPRSKKNASNSCRKKAVSENMRIVCKEALETLEQLLYTGVLHFKKNEFQEVFTKVLQIACTLRISHSACPFPYDEENCRKNLYSVLLALALVSSMDHTELIQTAAGLLKNAFQDPSTEVKGLCNIAMALLGTKIHPQRPPPKYRVSDQRQAKVSSAIVKCPAWTSDDFIPNLPLENASETRTFRDPSEGGTVKYEPMHEDVAAVEEVVESETSYSENYVSKCYSSKYQSQGAENHNGDDILEIHSNQCQDEESDEEDEEDDDERSYGEEEMNTGDISSENLYIPSTSKMQVVTPVHISAETVPQSVADREYEQLRPCVKAETTSADSNKNMHLNGVKSVPDADVPSSSLANENGVYPYEEDDLDEEEGEEDEEEEAPAAFVPEKRHACAPNAPSKKQKMEIDEASDEPKEEERTRSPTLEEMKADFHCTEIIDDVKS